MSEGDWCLVQTLWPCGIHKLKAYKTRFPRQWDMHKLYLLLHTGYRGCFSIREHFIYWSDFREDKVGMEKCLKHRGSIRSASWPYLYWDLVLTHRRHHIIYNIAHESPRNTGKLWEYTDAGIWFQMRYKGHTQGFYIPLPTHYPFPGIYVYSNILYVYVAIISV